MDRREMIRASLAALVGASLIGTTAGQSGSKKRKTKKILFFTKSAIFEHDVIRRVNGQPSLAEQVLTKMAPEHGFEFTFSKDGSVINAAYLKQFDAVFFYTCGFITSSDPNVDKQPPLTEAGKKALLDAIRNGMGFVGCHSASDTFHVGEGPHTNANPSRYKLYGPDADPYTHMLGGEIITHGAQQNGTMRVVNHKFPGFKDLPETFTFVEEWYSLKEFPKDLHVLLVQETEGMKGNVYKRAPYPATWAHKYGKGRVFYTSMGHREDMWENTTFQQILAGGLSWASRQVDADIKPNLKKVTPGYAEIPPQGR